MPSVEPRTARKTDLRQPEIKNLCVSTLGHKQVRRFDVPVDYAFGVSSIQCVRNLDSERQDQFGVQWPTTNAMLQGQSIQKLHRDEGLSVLVINLVDGADIRMIQCGRSLGFALKAGECLRVFGYIVGQELESHKAIEFDILGLIDDTHPAAAQLLDDAVVRDGLTNKLGRSCHWRDVRSDGREGQSQR